MRAPHLDGAGTGRVGHSVQAQKGPTQIGLARFWIQPDAEKRLGERRVSDFVNKGPIQIKTGTSVGSEDSGDSIASIYCAKALEEV